MTQIRIHRVSHKVIPFWDLYYGELFKSYRQHYVICDASETYGYLLGEDATQLFTVSSTPIATEPPLLVRGVPIANDDHLELLAFILENLNLEHVKYARAVVTLERLLTKTASPPDPLRRSLRCEFDLTIGFDDIE